jgi:hypothetical protein
MEVFDLPPHLLGDSHWARSRKGASGAPSNKHIHMGVGHALSNWEHVEAAISVLFSYFVETRTIAAARAFGSINGARARELAIRQASETFFKLRKQEHRKDKARSGVIKEAEKCASHLIRNYGLASARRNDFAHGIAYELSLKKAEQPLWFLVAPNHNSRKTANWIEDDFILRAKTGHRLSDPKAYFDYNKFYRKNAEYVFSVQQIKVFAGKFAYLYADMLVYAHEMSPEQFKLDRDQLYRLAKHLSD